MKNFSSFFLLLLIVVGCNSAFAQGPTPLYAGVIDNEQLVEIDTSGAIFTIVGTTTMTTDVGSVDGTFGLALHPITDVMYILYNNGDGECDRHLGTVDLTSGAITDIGNAGNLVDIDFGADGTLYATTGASCAPDYTFVEVNILTAATTDILDHISSTYGSTIGFNSFTGEMMHSDNNDISTIDLGTDIETVGVSSGHPGESHALVVLNPTLAWVISYDDLYTLDPTTGDFIYISSLPDYYHAMSFGPMLCTPMSLDVTSYSVCEGTEITIKFIQIKIKEYR